jgi:transcription elongation factor Elf1
MPAIKFGCLRCGVQDKSWRTSHQPDRKRIQYYCGNCGETWSWPGEKTTSECKLRVTQAQLVRTRMYNEMQHRFYCPMCARQALPVTQTYKGGTARTDYRFFCEECEIGWSLTRLYSRILQNSPIWEYKTVQYPLATRRPKVKMLLRRNAWHEPGK